MHAYLDVRSEVRDEGIFLGASPLRPAGPDQRPTKAVMIRQKLRYDLEA
jgi:hypothetical protein